jgi:hypothetical protein
MLVLVLSFNLLLSDVWEPQRILESQFAEHLKHELEKQHHALSSRHSRTLAEAQDLAQLYANQARIELKQQLAAQEEYLQLELKEQREGLAAQHAEQLKVALLKQRLTLTEQHRASVRAAGRRAAERKDTGFAQERLEMSQQVWWL